MWKFECPDGWEVIQRWGDGYACREIKGGLRVIVDCEQKRDGNLWLHVSYSRKDWTPSHADGCKVKAAFIVEKRYAYAVHPPAESYVNIHEHCLHLWAKWDESNGQVLPEFSEVLAVVGVSV